jgi:hypothetical protein
VAMLFATMSKILPSVYVLARASPGPDFALCTPKTMSSEFWGLRPVLPAHTASNSTASIDSAPSEELKCDELFQFFEERAYYVVSGPRVSAAGFSDAWAATSRLGQEDKKWIFVFEMLET